MTRIVAGQAGGRTLRVPGTGTRPTSDRVREALFSRLEHAGALDGTRVLDLYAGSGALGLEAASRGAGDVVLVESSARAARVCRQNVETLGLAGVRVVAERVQTFLTRPGGPVDLALVDPPYDLPEADLAGVLGQLARHLVPGATVVVERSSRSPEPAWPAATPADPGLHAVGSKTYGETRLWFAEAADAARSPDQTPARA